MKRKERQPMEILVENMQSKMEIAEDTINLLRLSAETSLKLEGFQTPCEVSFLIVDDEGIRDINREHRGIDRATDVLSFPIVDMSEGKVISNSGDFDLDENLLLLGDIVISIETAHRQAEEYAHSFDREMAFLATHGMFHLLGYDHEKEDEEKRMMDKQEKVLSMIGLTRK